MITIKTLEWFDKVNGNTYFSAQVHLGNDLIMSLPFQYGYNGACQEVETILCKHFNIPNAKYGPDRWAVREMLKKNGILISESKSNSLKKYLGKESFEDFTPFLKDENLALYAAHRMREGIALDHHTMENVFIDWLTSDGIGIAFANGSNELYSFNSFDWF